MNGNCKYYNSLKSKGRNSVINCSIVLIIKADLHIILKTCQPKVLKVCATSKKKMNGNLVDQMTDLPPDRQTDRDTDEQQQNNKLFLLRKDYTKSYIPVTYNKIVSRCLKWVRLTNCTLLYFNLSSNKP